MHDEPKPNWAGVGPKLVEALEGLTGWATSAVCLHEETYRGGTIWEICSQCGKKWPDDRGGKPDDAHEYPREIKSAREALALVKEERCRRLR